MILTNVQMPLGCSNGVCFCCSPPLFPPRYSLDHFPPLRQRRVTRKPLCGLHENSLDNADVPHNEASASMEFYINEIREQRLIDFIGEHARWILSSIAEKTIAKRRRSYRFLCVYFMEIHMKIWSMVVLLGACMHDL